MLLRFNENNGAFILYTKDKQPAIDAGLTMMTNVRGPNGEFAYFTADYNRKPDFNPYAALPFWRCADDLALGKMRGLLEDYKASWADQSDYDPPSPKGKTAMPYQRAGVAYGLKRNSFLIGDEPGLGKTIMAILYANAIDARKALIVVPASIRAQWCSQIVEWSTLNNVTFQLMSASMGGVDPNCNFNVVSYNLIHNPGIFKALMAIDWDLLVLDEAHYVKTVDALRTRAIFGGGAVGTPYKSEWIADRAKHVCALTGTYLPNRPREAFALAKGIDWQSISYLGEDAFKYRFNPSNKWKEEMGRLPELNARLRSNFMVRRLKEDVLPQLPPKRYEITYLEPNGAVQDVLAKESLIDFDPMQLYNPNFSLEGTPISTLRREMGVAKAPRVIEYARYLLDIVGIPKLVIFYHHKEVRAAMLHGLEKYGIMTSHGGQSPTFREAQRNEFINGKPRIWLAQHDTVEGADGIQHIAYSMLFAEPAWTPGRNEQCMDRCHRWGQQVNVLGQFAIFRGSFDEKVLHSVVFKAQNIHETLDRRY